MNTNKNDKSGMNGTYLSLNATTRHSRAGGNPLFAMKLNTMDPRLRGEDGLK